MAGVSSGMREVEYVLCDECGFERRADEFVDCMYCAMRSERLALAMEVESFRVELKDLRCELSKVKEEVWGVRQGYSVRPRGR